MRIIYVGPMRAVEVALPDGTRAVVKRGEGLDAHGALATGLLKQPSNWKADEPAAPPAHESEQAPKSDPTVKRKAKATAAEPADGGKA